MTPEDISLARSSAIGYLDNGLAWVGLASETLVAAGHDMGHPVQQQLTKMAIAGRTAMEMLKRQEE